MEWSLVISVIAAVISASSVGISIYVYRDSQKYFNDKHLASLANASLQNAFASLTEGRDAIPPKASRLNWLTTARHIEQYKIFKKRIKTALYKEACSQDGEIWRLKFFKILNMYNITDPFYYQNDVPLNDSSGIIMTGESLGLEPRSVAVIYDFAKNDGGEDLIDKVNLKKLVEEGNILSGNHGLRKFFEQSDEYAAILARQEEKK